MGAMVILKEKYDGEVRRALQESGRYGHPMALPRLVKIVLNVGVRAGDDRDALKSASEDMARITGQRPVVTHARKSIANFRLRTGMPIGAKVTLRGARMYEFLDRLINSALPRVRDFRGLAPKGFDGRGNYTLGLREIAIFPEIQPDQVKAAQGLDLTIVTTAKNDADARELLRLMGMPFASA